MPIDLSSQIGKWAPPITWPLIPIHTSVLPDGKVISWDWSGAQLWDPQTGSFTAVNNPTTNLFCSGHSLLHDGRLIVTGGHRFFNGDGEITTNIFNAQTATWSLAQNMNLGRWYPTTCALANGESMVLSGFYCQANCFPGSPNPVVLINPLPQVFQTNNTWRDLTSAVDQNVSLYPWLHLGPDGRVFYSGPDQGTRYLDTTATGAWAGGPSSAFGFRDSGTSVTYQPGRVLILGGGADPASSNQPTNTAEVIDLHAGGPSWQPGGTMARRRKQVNGTILADGRVLVTGGTSGAGFNNPCGTVLAAELWNPNTKQFSTMASMQIPRIYHSTAVLLPDARVLSAGSTAAGPGGYPGCTISLPDQFNAEIYTPPYLFNLDGSLASRPVITSAPSNVAYGQPFLVQTPHASRITRVTWVRLSSVTHSFNQNQRFNELKFEQIGGLAVLSVQAPSNPNLCPPGYYMLFIINGAGVPSVAAIIRI
jgi:hypothetical protein